MFHHRNDIPAFPLTVRCQCDQCAAAVCWVWFALDQAVPLHPGEKCRHARLFDIRKIREGFLIERLPVLQGLQHGKLTDPEARLFEVAFQQEREESGGACITKYLYYATQGPNRTQTRL